MDRLSASAKTAFSPKAPASGWTTPDGNSPTFGLSNTVCISDPEGMWMVVQEGLVEELSALGEIARLDTSLGQVLRCVLVTYFDVRCAQRALFQWADRAEPFPPAAHDCRVVRVNLESFAERAGGLKGFRQFGEVAGVSVVRGDAIVEFQDMRSAQFLLTAAGGCATPWPMQGAVGAPMLQRQPQMPPGILPSLLRQPELSSAELVGQAAKVGNVSQQQTCETPSSEAGLTPAHGAEKAAGAAARGAGNPPVRTKVSTKEFSKYDINLEKIQHGEDKRTTVMVRNLTGTNARKDFLLFLEKCGLAEKYTFFYMPCKEHRNVLAGFAFLNLATPADVHKLHVLVTSGFWREFSSDPQAKAPAVSYARFQGHEELAKHFSSSAVLHEQDPDKRPIFRQAAKKTEVSDFGLNADTNYPAYVSSASLEAQMMMKSFGAGEGLGEMINPFQMGG